MKIAVVCDWLVTFGGAEKVIADILTCFPQADLFAVVDFLSVQDRKRLLNKTSKTTFIQSLPFAKSKYRTYLPFMPLAIEQLDVSKYDLIISSSHAVAKGVLTGPDQVHICYTHSPMRYAWDLQHQYLQETGLDKKLLGWLARYYLHKMRLWDLRAAANVDYFLANSCFVARRLKKIYRREATVIYPGIETHQFHPGNLPKEDFYLTASRLVPYKKVDLIVKTFRHLPDKHLFVIGAGPDFKKIQQNAPSNVTLLGYQSNSVLINYMQRAQGFIFAAEEDFGLLPLEAQSCGTPVIAYGKGGALETVRGSLDINPTGVFFPTQTEDALCAAIQTFANQRALFSSENCIQHARQFSTEMFCTNLKNFVSNTMKASGHPVLSGHNHHDMLPQQL